MAGEKKSNLKKQRAKKQNFKLVAIRASFLLYPMEPLTMKRKRVAVEFGTSAGTIRSYEVRCKAAGDDWSVALHKAAEEAVQKEHELKVLEKHSVSTEIGFKDMVVEIKEFAYLTLHTSKKISETAIIMIDYYCGQIQELIKNVGGVGKLDAIQRDEIKIWQGEIKHYHSQIREFLQPAAVATFMRMIGIEEAAKADLDDIDKDAFTMDRLQETLNKMNMVTVLDNEEATANLVKRYSGPEIPDIEGKR